MISVKRLRFVLPVLVAALAVGAGVMWPPWNRPEPVLCLPGVVEIQEVRPGSKIGGRVAEMFVSEGDRVPPGAALIRLDVPELKAQRDQAAARLGAAEAALAKARKGARDEEKDAARATYLAAKARDDRMKKGWRTEEIREAEGEVESTRADLELATRDFERTSRLYNMGTGVGRSEYDAAHAALDRARGKKVAAESKFEMLSRGNREEDKAEAAATRAKAQADLDLLEHGTRPEDIAAAEANAAEAKGKLAELEANLQEAVVHAPPPRRSDKDRYIVEVLSVRPGDLLAPNTPMARLLLQAWDLWVKVYVPEPDVAQVRLGQKVDVTIDAYPGRRFPGQVIQVASVAEFTPRNVQSLEGRRAQVFGVKVRVEDPEGLFKSGMAAEVIAPLPAARGSR